MNIDHRLNDPLFAPTPLTGAQPRQDNDQRERVTPAAETDAFAGRDERRERGNDDVALYDARGQKTGNETAPTEAAEEQAGQTKDDPQTAEASARPSKPSGEPMSEQEVLELNDLKLRDQEVRTHEQQHAAVGGQHAGSPSYEYETGPDGKQYAVEGEVQVDMSPVPGDPEATIDKMQQIKAAALAPAEPSQADRSAAAQAEQLMAEARAELREQQRDTPQGTTSRGDTAQGEGPAARTGEPRQAPAAATEPHATSPSPSTADNRSQMQHRNEVIAGVYGRTAEHQARALIGLA